MVELVQDFTDENSLKWGVIMDSVQGQIRRIQEIEDQALAVPTYLMQPYEEAKQGLNAMQLRCLNAVSGRTSSAIQAPNEMKEFGEIKQYRNVLDMVWKAIFS